MKNILLQNWGFTRIIRLILGVVIIVQGFQQHSVTYSLLGFFLGGMAFFNFGCCGSAGCFTSKPTNVSTTTDEISFEEVK